MKSFFFSILSTGCLLMSLVSCGGPRYVDFFPCHDNGMPKPKVVLMPVMVPDDCEEGYSEVLEKDLRYCLMDHGQLFVFDKNDVDHVLSKRTIDVYGKDLSWTRCFKDADFVASIEAIEYCPYNYPCGCDMPYVVLKIRLRVIDLRGECPRVILYELFESCQQVIIPKGQEKTMPLQRGSHRLLCEKIVDRLERVIRSCN